MRMRGDGGGEERGRCVRPCWVTVDQTEPDLGLKDPGSSPLAIGRLSTAALRDPPWVCRLLTRLECQLATTARHHVKKGRVSRGKELSHWVYILFVYQGRFAERDAHRQMLQARLCSIRSAFHVPLMTKTTPPASTVQGCFASQDPRSPQMSIEFP